MTLAQVKVSHVLVSITQYVVKHFVIVNTAILSEIAFACLRWEKLLVTQVFAQSKDVLKIVVVFVRITSSTLLICDIVSNVSFPNCFETKFN